MREQEPMTQKMKISDVKNTLSSLVNKVYRKETRVLVEKSGIPVAALVSADDLERLTRLDVQRAEDFKSLDATRAAFADVPDEALEQEVANAVAAARAKRGPAAKPRPAPTA